jgi:O-antigen ligase
MEIWKDHKALGVGPGMFGGVISIVFNSPVYKEYNFSQKWYDFMKPFRSLDQFWPQIMAEMGTIGALIFAGLFISLLIIFYLRRKHASDDEEKGLFAGLMIATVYIFIYSLGSGLNMTLFLFTYSALAGMVLGYENTFNK